MICVAETQEVPTLLIFVAFEEFRNSGWLSDVPAYIGECCEGDLLGSSRLLGPVANMKEG
jgi:hypothetical protein